MRLVDQFPGSPSGSLPSLVITRPRLVRWIAVGSTVEALP
jgi:hypothetical protein